jgi:hypothetical protein
MACTINAIFDKTNHKAKAFLSRRNIADGKFQIEKKKKFDKIHERKHLKNTIPRIFLWFQKKKKKKKKKKQTKI